MNAGSSLYEQIQSFVLCQVCRALAPGVGGPGRGVLQLCLFKGSPTLPTTLQLLPPPFIVV